MLIGAVNAFNGETNKVLGNDGNYKEVPELAKMYKTSWGTGSIVIGDENFMVKALAANMPPGTRASSA